MGNGNPKFHKYVPQYKSEMRIFRNNKGQLFIKLRSSKELYLDAVYILQPYRTTRLTDDYKKEVVGFTGWHTILEGSGFPGFAKGMQFWGRHVDDETVFEAINSISMDFNDPYLVTQMY